jgi:hypothetical protein
MPQVPSESGGWIDASKLAIPPQTLDASDVDAFLEYLFSEVAQRPAPLYLRETAAVARYLSSLEALGVPLTVLARRGDAIAAHDRWSESEEDRWGRLCVGQMTKIIWGFLLQSGQFKESTRKAALDFMRRHSDTYLANPYLELALAFIETHDVPPNAPPLFRPAVLRSGHMSVQSENITVADDLSDRIFAAYHALPRAGSKRRSARIAAALTGSRAGSRVRKSWSWADVNERVKAYARSQRNKFRNNGYSGRDVKTLLEQEEAWRTDYWISSFKFARQVRESGPSG